MTIASRLAFGMVLAAVAVPAQAGPVSPDGRWRATIRPERGPEATNGDRPTSLWLTDLRTGRARLLFRGRGSGDPAHDTASVSEPNFSLDGGYVYVNAAAYATSPVVHQIDVRTGAERRVIDGALVGVLRTGPWRGYLLVSQHRYRSGGGGSYDPVIVFRPDGTQIATVFDGTHGDERSVITRWLRAKRWRMD